MDPSPSASIVRKMSSTGMSSRFAHADIRRVALSIRFDSILVSLATLAGDCAALNRPPAILTASLSFVSRFFLILARVRLISRFAILSASAPSTSSGTEPPMLVSACSVSFASPASPILGKSLVGRLLRRARHSAHRLTPDAAECPHVHFRPRNHHTHSVHCTCTPRSNIARPRTYSLPVQLHNQRCTSSV